MFAKWLMYQVQAEHKQLCAVLPSVTVPWPSSLSPSDTPSPGSICPPLHLTLPRFPGRFTKKQPGLHGNVKTAEKWQLNAAAPHLILTLALTEQIMGNNTPLCCGKMKCFSRRLSCWGDLFVTVPAQISLYFPSFLFIPPFSWQSFFLFSLPHFFPIPLFYSFSFCTSSFHFPSFSSLSESLMSIYESIHM